jgi:hypothetical protein
MSWKKFRVWKFLTPFLTISPHSKRQGSGTLIVLVVVVLGGSRMQQTSHR